MWGPWFLVTLGGLLLVLLLVGIAFGTSALLFPVLIVAGIAIVIGLLYVLGAVGRREATTPDPVADAAPAQGEGSEPARS
jgi:hypothetical protein